MTYMDAVYMGIGAMLGSLLTFVGLALVAMAGRYAPSPQSDVDRLAVDVAAMEERLRGLAAGGNR